MTPEPSVTMHYTVFDTPVIKPFLRVTAHIILKIIGWKTVNRSGKETKYLLIAAPHTSNWDFPLFLLLTLAMDIKTYWLGKHTLFKWPFEALFRWLGGISVNRTRNTNMVQQCIDHFDSTTDLIIVSAPEGTRSRVNKWKTGFYHIATGADVPIGLGYLDYKKKEGGIMGMFKSTGNLDSDLKTIKEYYANISGKNIQQFSK